MTVESPYPPLAELLAALDVSVDGALPGAVSHVSTDTRTLTSGSLFVALRGEVFDGHRFVNSAELAGATAAVVERGEVGRLRDAGVRIALIGVEDTLAAYGAIASAHRQRMPARLVAVAGSNGKTTTKEMVASILSRHARTLSTRANHNNRIGVPQTLLRLRVEDALAVIEVGTNEPGEVAALTAITRPEALGVFVVLALLRRRPFRRLAMMAAGFLVVYSIISWRCR